MTEVLSESVLMSLTAEAFSDSGYSIKREFISDENVSRKFDLLAEDDFGFVGLEIYNTWEELVRGWSDTQASLVRLVSQKIARTAPRFFDAYLVLICRSPINENYEKFEIERDTNRVRKIIVTSEELISSAVYLRSLGQLLPLEVGAKLDEKPDPLETLPDLLRDNVDPELSKIAIDAYKDLQSPIEAIHKALVSS
ncbi:MAG: hypothetical protein ABJ275_01610 [Maricaulaceae bacterium]